jgi:uncharacterized protein
MIKALKISEKSGMILLPVRVQPRAAANQIVGLYNGALKVRVAAPAVQEKANRELLHFLARLLDLSSSDLRLLRGPKSKSKSIGIRGLSKDQVVERIAQYIV